MNLEIRDRYCQHGLEFEESGIYALRCPNPSCVCPAAIHTSSIPDAAPHLRHPSPLSNRRWILKNRRRDKCCHWYLSMVAEYRGQQGCTISVVSEEDHTTSALPLRLLSLEVEPIVGRCDLFSREES